MTKTATAESRTFSDIAGVTDYLENECYCPGEVYETNGIFFLVFEPSDTCTVIADTTYAAVCVTDKYDKDGRGHGKLICFFRPEAGHSPDVVEDAFLCDTTPHNIAMCKVIANGGWPDGQKLDTWGKPVDSGGIKRLSGMVDAIMG